MEADKVTPVQEFLEELTILVFVALKGIGLAVSSLLFAFASVLYYISLWLFVGLRCLYNLIRNWDVVVPNVLKFTE